MRIASSLFVLVALSMGGVALAQDATDPTVIARQATMKQVGASMKVLGEMANGKTAFDAAKAAEAQAALVAAAGQAPERFKQPATDPASEAKPEIWTNWDDFLGRLNGLHKGAEAVDPSSLDSLKASIGKAGGACKDCHSVYRM